MSYLRTISATYFLLAVFTCGQLFTVVHLEAANLYALLVADTVDESIGDYCGKDIRNMQKELQTIASKTGLKLSLTALQGGSTVADQVLQHLAQIQPGKDDVVFLYFSMHGFRTPSKQDIWPDLYFNNGQNALDFNSINQIAISKNPRLLISIADVCNNVLPDGAIPMVQAKALLDREKASRTDKNYRQLFLSSAGTIIVSGCIPGESSWSYRKGSLYTLEWMKSLKTEVEGKGVANWTTLLNRASQGTVNTSSGSFGELQTPQYQISLR